MQINSISSLFSIQSLLSLPVSCSFLQFPNGTNSTLFSFFLFFLISLGGGRATSFVFIQLGSQRKRYTTLKLGSFEQCILTKRLITNTQADVKKAQKQRRKQRLAVAELSPSYTPRTRGGQGNGVG